MAAFTASKLRTQVRRRLMGQLTSGSLKAGRINESELAHQIGVSRTPLREALVSLEQEGFVIARERGFEIPPLKALEVRQVYPILGSLEALALETSGIPSQGKLRKLRALNTELSLSRNSGKALDIDNAFHGLLLDGCPNLRLMGLIATHKLLIQRYELAYLGNPQFVAHSVKQHATMLKLLENGNITAATKVIVANWRSTLEFLLQRLDWETA